MLDLLAVLSLLTGVLGVGFLVRAIPVRWLPGRPRSRRILAERLGGDRRRPDELPSAKGESPSRGRWSLLPTLTHLLARTRARHLLAQLEQALTLARIPLKPVEFIYLTAASLALALIIVQLTTNSMLLTLAITLAAAFTPFYYLRLMQHRRFLKIDTQVADTLLLLTNSLRSGASFLDSMDVVSARPPINEEFTRALREITLGVPVDRRFARARAARAGISTWQ